MNRRPIPGDLENAVIQCCGTVVHYHSDLKAIFQKCGVSENLWLKYADKPKFVIARSIMRELNQRGSVGAEIQHRLVLEFTQMEWINYGDVPDREAGMRALAELKSLASRSAIETLQEDEKIASRQSAAQSRLDQLASRSRKLSSLKQEFSALFTSADTQGRGYALESILQRLFEIFEIEYDPPYKLDAEQTDGFFKYRNHHYLVEARWREKPPTLSDLRAFKGKVEDKFQGCRGMFVSIAPFREAVVSELDTPGNPVFLVDARDLLAILEERRPLPEALDAKIEHASKTGQPHLKLYE